MRQRHDDRYPESRAVGRLEWEASIGMEWTKPCRDAVGFLALVAVGMGLLYLRDPHSLLVPTLYTEDGVWMAKLFNRGFWHTLIHAKGDETPYFVSLNILLLQAAKSLNAACYGDSIAHLPHFVSGLSMAFYAVLAAAPVWLLRPFLAPAARGLLWGLVILMPLGESSFEVLGRISNIGFGMLFLCFCLLAWRRSADRSRPWRIATADMGVFLCATTNPLCFPIVAADYAIRGRGLWRGGVPLRTILSRNGSARSAAGLAVALVAAACGMGLLEPRPNPFLKDTIRGSELVEAVLARPLLFPFVFPFYSWLSDVTAVAGLAVLAGVAWWLTAPASNDRRLMAAAGGVGLYAAVATVVMRPGLTRVLDGYSTTMLDRYYYGSSLFMTAAACVAVSAGLRCRTAGRRGVAAICGILIIAVYAGGIATLVETGRSRWHDPPAHDFASAVAAAAAEPTDAPLVRVQLHPRAWHARFPIAAVRATAIAVAADALRR